MWINYFLAVACIITIIRLVIFATSGDSFNDKMAKAKNWVIGLILLCISWFVLAKLFGINTSMKINNNGDTEVNSSILQQDTLDTNNGTGTVPINIE